MGFEPNEFVNLLSSLCNAKALDLIYEDLEEAPSVSIETVDKFTSVSSRFEIRFDGDRDAERGTFVLSNRCTTFFFTSWPDYMARSVHQIEDLSMLVSGQFVNGMVGQFFGAFDSLKSLYLTDPRAGLLDAFFPRLQKLKLNSCDFDETTQVILGKAIAELGDTIHLKEMVFIDMQFQRTGFDAILDGLAAHKGLKKLGLHCYLDSADAAELDKLSRLVKDLAHLEKLDIAASGLECGIKCSNFLTEVLSKPGLGVTLGADCCGDESCEAVGAAFTKHRATSRFSWTDQDFTPENIRTLAQGIGDNSSLVFLDLSNCTFDGISMGLLVNALSGNVSLKELHIGNRDNEIEDEVLARLLNGLIQTRSIKRLVLWAGDLMGEHGREALGRYIGASTTLLDLTLHVEFFETEVARSIANGIRHSRCIERLEIGISLSLYGSSGEELLRGLEENTSLTELDAPSSDDGTLPSKLDFYLKLNKLKRGCILDPDFRTDLLPYILTKMDLDCLSFFIREKMLPV